ncbi:putative UDP-glucuronosyl/UDP-glucosyltransferase, UDP-glycosyltransferase family [Helianthus annuus]|nr:putative UDP-glucuronosyl/UDP-glucosyltransferase, UDP-glycosyltransferase family [Helianthus annuus]
MMIDWIPGMKGMKVRDIPRNILATKHDDPWLYLFMGVARMADKTDLVDGKTTVLPQELEEVIRKRGFVASWCPQEEVLNHYSVGGFLAQGGSGSMIESLSDGVPMICWPGNNDQRVNCIQMCKEWEVAMATSLKGYGLKSCADQMS